MALRVEEWTRRRRSRRAGGIVDAAKRKWRFGVEIGAAMREICPGICPGTARLTPSHSNPHGDWAQGSFQPPTPPAHHGYANGVGT